MQLYSSSTKFHLTSVLVTLATSFRYFVRLGGFPPLLLVGEGFRKAPRHATSHSGPKASSALAHHLLRVVKRPRRRPRRRPRPFPNRSVARRSRRGEKCRRTRRRTSSEHTLCPLRCLVQIPSGSVEACLVITSSVDAVSLSLQLMPVKRCLQVLS